MFKVKTAEAATDCDLPIVRGRVRCECGALKHAFQIVDVRHMDIERNWACDGCWTSWQRGLKPLGKGHSPKNRKEWDQKWFKDHGAPKAVLDMIQKQKRRS